MARKFLYFVAIVIVLVIAALLGLRYFASEVSTFAFVPNRSYERQQPLPAGRYDDPAQLATMWLARPAGPIGNLGVKDFARFLPDGANAQQPPLGAAVFFIHPSSYLAKAHWNAPLDDGESNERAELFVRAMASPFNASADVWAPRYRQAAFGAFLTDKPEALQALDAAYGDVLEAFDSFIAHTDPAQPIILAGHSQGAYHLKRLLMERVKGKPLARRIAAAYVIGWPVSLEHDLPLLGLPACASPDQAGCAMSWLSFAEPADPAMIQEGYESKPALDGKLPGKSPFLCSNPLTGRSGGSAPASANLGTLLPASDLKSGKLIAGMVPARCGADGFLYIGEPPQLGAYVLPGNNYHVYDIPLFWANVRADAARRTAAWKP